MTPSSAELTFELIDVARLDELGRERLRHEMIALEDVSYVPAAHASAEQVAADKRDYYAHCTDPSTHSRFLKAAVFRRQGRMVAFFIAYVRWIDVDGEKVELIRGSASTLAEYRAAGLFNRAYLAVAADYFRRYGMQSNARIVSGVVYSPVMYESMMKRARHVFPSHRPSADPRLRRAFRVIHGSETDFVTETMIGSHEPISRRAKTRRDESPSRRYFHEINPRYADGYALRVVVRVGRADFLYALAVSAGLAASRRIRRMIRSTDRAS